VRSEQRLAVRAVLLSHDDELLLMRMVDHARRRSVWITPGGGLEPGESALAGLERELREETGLLAPAIGPELWTRTHTFKLADRELTQHERFFLVRAARFEPSAAGMPDEPERAWFDSFRWWPISEIERSQDWFAPAGSPACCASSSTTDRPRSRSTRARRPLSGRDRGRAARRSAPGDRSPAGSRC
jgi:ADP-ribose pyrophosphatase YjhB (NUDIX family)